MSVCHCLFWKQNNKIITILKNRNDYEIIKIEGEVYVEYDENFWNMWLEYVGFLKDDVTDFCFVYDDVMPCVSDFLNLKECSEKEFLWDIYSIQEVANLLNIVNPTVIHNKDGKCIAKTGVFRKNRDRKVVKLTAVYNNSENDIVFENVIKDKEITPLIREMLEKLKKYDEER